MRFMEEYRTTYQAVYSTGDVLCKLNSGAKNPLVSGGYTGPVRAGRSNQADESRGDQKDDYPRDFVKAMSVGSNPGDPTISTLLTSTSAVCEIGRRSANPFERK